MKNLIWALILLPFITMSQGNSVLNDGNWYKFSVNRNGVFKISFDDLESFGINASSIDPRQIAIFGNKAEMLPEHPDSTAYSDLTEFAIKVVGEEDGFFDPEDYILFYGESPTQEITDLAGRKRSQINYYSNSTYYYLTTTKNSAKRISDFTSLTQEPDTIVLNLYGMALHEKELYHPGKSGKNWLGEEITGSDTLEIELALENMADTNKLAKLYFNFGANSLVTSSVEIFVNGELIKDQPLPIIAAEGFEYYRLRSLDTTMNLGGSKVVLGFHLKGGDEETKLWLDKTEVFYLTTKNLSTSAVKLCYDAGNNGEIAEFEILHTAEDTISIWDVSGVTDVKNIISEKTEVGDKFRLSVENHKDFYFFKDGQYYSVTFEQEVENQNLHADFPPNYLIITDKQFKFIAMEFANFHQTYDGMSTGIAFTDEIYNEFSSGTADVSGIRNYIKNLYLKSGNSNPKYILILGDASFDYKGILPETNNIVPVWESVKSNDIISAYSTDLFYGLNNMEGDGETKIAIGRLPVKNMDEATSIITKVKRYYQVENFNKSRNNVMLIADDGDNNIHLNNTELIAEDYNSFSPANNIDKVYLDFFELIDDNGNPRYPDVNQHINMSINSGINLLNYTGHSNNNELSAERIMSNDDLQYWDNFYNMPLFVMATGDVCRFDDEERSLGVNAVLLPEAGPVAVLGLNSLSYVSVIKETNLEIIQKLTNPEAYKGIRLGDLLKFNNYHPEQLKWQLIGDPALKYALPYYQVNTVRINNMPIENFQDTISPGSEFILEGEIIDKETEYVINSFNGSINLDIIAPAYTKTTRANQEGSLVEDVVVQDSILSTFSTSVSGGRFTFNVSLPDKFYPDYGNLKLSYYATNNETDAAGFNKDLIYGGSPNSINSNYLNNLVELFPVPATEFLNIKINETENKEFDAELIDSKGVRLMTIELNNGLNTLNTLSLKNGIYYLKVTDGSNIAGFKFIKH